MTDLPPALHLGPFTYSWARAEGVVPSRLRGHDLHVPFRGVRALDAATTHTQRALSFAPLLVPGLAFSHAVRRAADIDRREQLAREGWLIVQVVSAHLGDRRAITVRVADAIVSRGWRPNRRAKSHLLLDAGRS